VLVVGDTTLPFLKVKKKKAHEIYLVSP